MTVAVLPLAASPSSDALERAFRELLAAHGPALERLTRGYEVEPERRRDLHQDILAALWRSLSSFQGRSSLRTWAFRVAHNTAVSLALRPQQRQPPLLSLEEAEVLEVPTAVDLEADADRRTALARLERLLQELRPTDRALMLLYLEDCSAAEIAEVTGLTPGHVSVKVHRIKALLARRFAEEGPR